MPMPRVQAELYEFQEHKFSTLLHFSLLVKSKSKKCDKTNWGSRLISVTSIRKIYAAQ